MTTAVDRVITHKGDVYHLVHTPAESGDIVVSRGDIDTIKGKCYFVKKDCLKKPFIVDEVKEMRYFLGNFDVYRFLEKWES